MSDTKTKAEIDLRFPVFAEPIPVDWVESVPNANNERVRKRLEDDKAQLLARVDSSDVTGSTRVGSPVNKGDLSNGGMGGDFGTSTVISERGVAEDAAQHTAADAAAGRLADARSSAMDGNGWGKPVGQATAAASDLLGDDAPAAGKAGVAGNPATAKGKAKADAGAGGFVAPGAADATT